MYSVLNMNLIMSEFRNKYNIAAVAIILYLMSAASCAVLCLSPFDVTLLMLIAIVDNEST